jgi:hypothetical protein
MEKESELINFLKEELKLEDVPIMKNGNFLDIIIPMKSPFYVTGKTGIQFKIDEFYAKEGKKVKTNIVYSDDKYSVAFY